jgi:hypothetical protein
VAIDPRPLRLTFFPEETSEFILLTGFSGIERVSLFYIGLSKMFLIAWLAFLVSSTVGFPFFGLSTLGSFSAHILCHILTFYLSVAFSFISFSTSVVFIYNDYLKSLAWP